MLAGLSTVWYAGGKRCHKPIRITSTRTGRSVVARVVDECDSSGHGGCKSNVIVTSKAVWKALGLHTKLGQAHVICGANVKYTPRPSYSSGHGGCKSNVIVTSKAVWKALGLHTKLGQAHVTWSDA
ncbi:hypothetical protein U9M48_009550 [Paspalum notatum var. saurae]|uniref:Uncharacterized protein n=1 Tax=Paspalum notatum var. saurae TaxID=547442 RepID=A0AAQ3SS12_PASNO